MIKQKYIDIERRMGVAERRLENQVGESRCYKMREECRNTLANGMNEIKEEIINNRNWVTDRFTEIVRFMGAHNGK